MSKTIESTKNGDILVHYSAIIDSPRNHKSLIKGERVEFDLVKTADGLKAKNVTSKK